jgi:coenzyme F420-reducing hydrogenase alpha subunit
MASDSTTRTIVVEALARIEGEAGLTLKLEDGKVVDALLRVFEPPRLFEAFLRGRAAVETPDITARICGICPVAYQMSACHAVEDAFGVKVEGALRELRRLLYCGEWIESHVLHMFLLHAPDFLGLPDAIALSRAHPERVRAALGVKKAGNAIVALLGGREIHPINVRVGGFYRVPRAAELAALLPELRAARDQMEELVPWLGGLEFPRFDREYELVALRHPAEYPMNEGRLVSTRGLDIDVHEYGAHIVEEQAAHTTALRARILVRGAYLSGPLARFALGFDRLSPRAQDAARRVGLDPSCRNPFRTLLIRGVEVIHALDEAIRIIEGYAPPAAPAVPIVPRAGTGHAITEAPRGILYHRYAIDAEGLITEAQIAAPTSQNQRSIEEDLIAMGAELARLPEAAATQRAEHAIRNHDPCISCSAHFLRLRFDRS